MRNGIEKEKGRMCPVFFYALQRRRRGGGACAGILMPSERRMHVNGVARSRCWAFAVINPHNGYGLFASSVLEALRFAIHPADDAFLEGAICLYGVFPGSENIFLLPPFSLLKEKGGPVLMRFATVDCIM